MTYLPETAKLSHNVHVKLSAKLKASNVQECLLWVLETRHLSGSHEGQTQCMLFEPVTVSSQWPMDAAHWLL